MRVPHLIRAKFPRAETSRDRSRPILVFGVVLYVTRVIAPGWRTGFPSFFPDSSSYVEVSRLGPFDPSFWTAERPIGVPLALWLTGGNHRLFFLVQTVLFAVSVACLCSVVLKAVTPRWLAWITTAVIASVCVHPRFGLWNLEILSESLSLSLSILICAIWLQFARSPTRRHLVHGIIAIVVWMSLRDAHIVSGLVIASALLIGGLTCRTWTLRKTALIGSAILAIFSSYVLLAQGSSNRNLYPLINNIGERVLPNEDLLRTFASQQMPIDAALLERTGDDTWSDNQAFLRSAELERFRRWADQHGQRAMLTSLVVDAPYWVDTTGEALHSSLPLDFSEYDRHSTTERLPTRLFWVQGPRTSTQLALWGLASAVSLAVIFGTSRRRRSGEERPGDFRKRCGTIAVVGIATTAADLYISASGDSVEVQRHLLGPTLRLSLLVILTSAFGASALIRLIRRLIEGRFRGFRPRSDDARPKHPVSMSGSIAASLAAVGAFGTWIAIEHRSQDFDPQYARTIIERAARFGGTYYENGIHNKGPLETVVYDSARMFTNFDTYWFGISIYVIGVSIVLGLTAAMIAHWLGASRRLAVTAAALVVAHFALSESDYAGVLYSRNITTALLALVVAATLWDAPWRKPRFASTTYVALIVLLGLAVQTLLTTVFAAIVVGSFLYVRRSTATTLRQPLLAAFVTATATIASAPAWYAIRGSFAEFWSNWWTYAGFMSSSTGRSLLNQIGLGGEKIFGYYQDRPGIALMIFVHVGLVARTWRAMTTSNRTVHTMLLAWLCAGWVELVLSQRYSSHYYSVVAVPTSFIGVAVAVLVYQELRRADEPLDSKPRSWWVSIACVIALITAQGTQLTWIAIEGAGRFRNTEQYVQARNDVRSGKHWTHQAVMDLVSSNDDPLLAWTMYPWTYLDHRRVPATRFSWKSFMIGEVYLGRTSPDYVLERTWEWFEQDVAESSPAVFARPQVTELAPATPLSAFVAEKFSIVFADDDIEIGWRNDLWETAVGPTQADESIDLAELPSSWSHDPSGDTIIAESIEDADFESDSGSWDMDLSCRRMSTRIIRSSVADPMGLTFRFDSPDEKERAVSLNVDFDRAWSSRHDDAVVDSPVELDATILTSSNRTSLVVTLLVTKSAAAVIVDDRIVSAIPLENGARVTISPTVDETEFTTPILRRLDGFAGC